jgi:hypothetical protein
MIGSGTAYTRLEFSPCIWHTRTPDWNSKMFACLDINIGRSFKFDSMLSIAISQKL